MAFPFRLPLVFLLLGIKLSAIESVFLGRMGLTGFASLPHCDSIVDGCDSDGDDIVSLVSSRYCD